MFEKSAARSRRTSSRLTLLLSTYAASARPAELATRLGWRGGVLELALEHRRINAAAAEQRVVIADLSNAASFQDDNQVCADDRTQAVGHDERGAVDEQTLHGGLDELLALGVQVTS